MRKTILVDRELFNKNILPMFTPSSSSAKWRGVVDGGDVVGSVRYNLRVPYPGSAEETDLLGAPSSTKAQDVEADRVYRWSLQ